MNIGVLIDRGRIARWQAEALCTVAEGNRFTIYDCTNSTTKRDPLRHGLYYLLNLAAVRNPMTARAPIPAELVVDAHIRFEAERDGAWERLPQSILDRIAKDEPEVIVKFGMGLLRVPDELACPILSFHHGDPRLFRGRPAGFYELLSGASEVGQVVQILSNRLDAGRVVASAATKAHPHSWRRTLIEAFRASPLLLAPAIRGAIEGRTIALDPNGRNYRLPSNFTALRFALKLGSAKARRLAYGAFAEKRWRVAEADLPPDWSPDKLDALAHSSRWRTVPLPPNSSFLADPFYAADGALLAEAMRANGRGEIVEWSGGEWRPLPIPGGHCSYPATVEWDGRSFVLPEMGSWSPPRLFERTDGGLVDGGELDVPDRPRLSDATLHCDEGTWFLFANRRDEGDRVLRLWVANSPLGPFSEHPVSPIRISPAGARMGGGIFALGSALFRPGQDFTRAYGDGLVLFRIDELSRDTYRESECARLRFRDRNGPHTLNIRGSKAVFDYYEDKVTPLAGIRRLRQSRSG